MMLFLAALLAANEAIAIERDSTINEFRSMSKLVTVTYR